LKKEKGMNRKLGRLSPPIRIASALGLALIMTSAGGTVTNIDCDVGAHLQTAVDAARPGDTILVRGVCVENIRVVDEAARFTLDGQGSATIRGANPGANTILVAGRNITIRGFTITGGLNGVAVLQGGTVLIDSNIIQESFGNGINLAQHSYARIVNNTIQLNPAAGIRVLENSSARIGFLNLENPVPRGNVIRMNGAAGGVLVQRSSGASLAGNNISENDGPGVSVSGASHADLAGNHIDGNGSDGVTVTENSYVQLGDEPGILNPPNDTTVPNVGFGLRCSLNSSAAGRLATLTGAEGTKNFDPSCTNGLEDSPGLRGPR
jgi:parallel beta-helix repeat protein